MRLTTPDSQITHTVHVSLLDTIFNYWRVLWGLSWTLWSQDPSSQSGQGFPLALFILIYFAGRSVCWCSVGGSDHRPDPFSFLHGLPLPVPSAAPRCFQPVSVTHLASHYISWKLLLNTNLQQSRTKHPAECCHTARLCSVTLTATLFFLYMKLVQHQSLKAIRQKQCDI